jgi:PAS domain S-box-containing protein
MSVALVAGIAAAIALLLMDVDEVVAAMPRGLFPMATLVVAAGWVVAAVRLYRRRENHFNRENETRLQAVLDAAPVAMIMTRENDGRVHYANHRAGLLVGIPSEALIGKKFSDYYVDRGDRDVFRKRLSENGFLTEHEVQLKKEDGTPVWVLTTARLITLFDDKLIIGGILDISARKAAEEESQHFQEELERRISERTAELALVNDELREARDRLEERVEERVSELAAINQILQDEIRERLRTAELLRLERDKAQRYLDVAGVITIALDPDGNVTLINRAGCRLFGYDEEEFLGRNLFDTIYPPDIRETVKQRFRQVMRGESEVPEVTESDIVTRSGERLSIRWHDTVIRDDDRIIGSLSSGEDVTDQRRAEDELRTSEQRFRSVVDNIGIGVTLVSPKMEVLELNKQMRDWFPDVHVSDRPICYRAFNDPPRDTVCSYCAVRLTLMDGLMHESTTETPSANTVRNFHIVATPIHDRDGNITGVIEMTEDVTDRLRAEEEQRSYTRDLERMWQEQTRLAGELSRTNADLAESKHETEEALGKLKAAQAMMVHTEKMASVGVLAAGIAHEINNPIGFVSSNLRELINYAEKIRNYLLRSRDLEDCVGKGDLSAAAQITTDLHELNRLLKLDFVMNDLTDLVRESLEGTTNIETIVKALKSYSRQDDATQVELDVCHIMDNSLRVVWNQIKYKADVVKEYDKVPRVYGSSGALHQVFSNLLVNAAQAITDHGQISIGVHVRGESVGVTVADNGCGISPDNLAHVFDPFFTTKDVGQGTGLGLSIAYDIVKKHNGNILVDSTPGVGSTFTVCLPAVRAKSPAPASKEILS